ncbi:transaldolase family protein [Providencia sneebia]|uniref:Fructose-6-phosphate aldolase n=1 Tax=Providencia sneebia DSM 19967 TaxID=1141660 RepID=K8WR40_9GAMM|nr:fructose-6-phosphate aldolase [Providencia sneebia DSM 19967]
MELYIDSADCTAIAELAKMIPINGVTTNPSIMAKAGVDPIEVLTDLRKILGEHALLFAQVLATNTSDIIKEAQYLHNLDANMIVKIPANLAGIAAINELKKQEIRTLATAVYSTSQAIMAAFAGAEYIAPYFNRMDNNGIDAKKVITEIQQFIQLQKIDCKILAASFKNTHQVVDCLLAGATAVTLPVDVLHNMVNSALADNAINDFCRDWQQAYKRISFI